MAPFHKRLDSHPEFILLGRNNRVDGGVTIKAGRNFTEEEWCTVYEVGGFPRHEMKFVMWDVVEVKGATYEEAFAKLFGQWSPDMGDTPLGALPDGEYFADKVFPIKEIEGGADG